MQNQDPQRPRVRIPQQSNYYDDVRGQLDELEEEELSLKEEELELRRRKLELKRKRLMSPGSASRPSPQMGGHSWSDHDQGSGYHSRNLSSQSIPRGPGDRSPRQAWRTPSPGDGYDDDQLPPARRLYSAPQQPGFYNGPDNQTFRPQQQWHASRHEQDDWDGRRHVSNEQYAPYQGPVSPNSPQLPPRFARPPYDDSGRERLGRQRSVYLDPYHYDQEWDPRGLGRPEQYYPGWSPHSRHPSQGSEGLRSAEGPPPPPPPRVPPRISPDGTPLSGSVSEPFVSNAKSSNPWSEFLKSDEDTTIPGNIDPQPESRSSPTPERHEPQHSVQTPSMATSEDHSQSSDQNGAVSIGLPDETLSKPPLRVPEVIIHSETGPLETPQTLVQDPSRTQDSGSQRPSDQEAPRLTDSPKADLGVDTVVPDRAETSSISSLGPTVGSTASVTGPASSRTSQTGAIASEKAEESDDNSEKDTIADFDRPETCNCGKVEVGKDECYFCWPCNGEIFCKKCWDKCPPHKSKLLGRQVGLPHEKSDPVVARRIFETLQSDRDAKEQARLHDQDEDTSWFGTGKDTDTGDTVFRDFGRYSRLVEELSSRRRLTRFPALVSFVGQTGAGKSSLIRLLIETLAPASQSPEVPVVGSTLHTDVATSGDVHLYPDTTTFETNQPIFYADCEGLDGGERQPMGARKNKPSTSNPRTQSFTKHIRKQHHTSEREIMWANTPLTTSREYHVRHLYPRLLFTFSDVIVFVMKNPRVIESVIEQLIDWAAAALETSSNQPVLPHAIIVLNATDGSADPALWDVNNSTIDLLKKVDRAVHQNHKLRKFAEFWREKGRQIETVETLLLSYYSSIRVVRMPEKGRPTLIHDQVRRLYQEVKEACEKSRESKHKLRMLLNSDELQPYLQHAFDHFCKNLERPFDFVQASLAFHPIPSNFGGNILKMAINIMEVWKDRLDGPSIIKELSFLVASCIMLDSARRRTLGPAEKVFAGYVHHCDDVLDSFCNLHWPCEYVNPVTMGRCVNVRAGHQSKGHQLSNGKVIAVGTYQSDFTADRYREFFEYSVAHNLRDLLRLLHSATQGSLESAQKELIKAAEIHRDTVLDPFFRHLGGSMHFINHTACYSCLTCPPEHPLPCGHVLCASCVQAYGKTRGPSIVEITECPLHHHEPDGQFKMRWPIFIKPPEAGSRVLVLDGGGVRGIVELTILQHVEAQLGSGLPIQAFFDLIVGTSTGGIIALGLGANGWSVNKCITAFKELCKQSFKRTWGLGLPGMEQFISLSGGARYDTASVESSLQHAFGLDQSLFAGPKDFQDNEVAMHRTTKVAVTTTTTGGSAALLGNYNRANGSDDAPPYSFPRSEKPDTEIKTWEAARSTAAAPTMFKAYAHAASGQVYLDGAIRYNCPIGPAVREQKLIWPETADRCPDIVLSIGSGINVLNRKPLPKGGIQRRGLFNGVRTMYKTAVDHISTSLNAEKIYKDYVDHSQIPEHLQERFVRLNLKMQKDPPRMDDTAQLQELEDKTRSQYTKDVASVKAVADRLIATAFYFVLDQEIVPFGRPEADNGPRTVAGRIQCRFAPHSQELKALGETLRRRSRDAYRQQGGTHNPYFIVCERRDGLENSVQHVLQPGTVDQMSNEGIFTMDRLKITLTSRHAETEMLFSLGDQPNGPVLYPISGFPRTLIEELNTGPKVQRTPSSHVAKTSQYKLDWADFDRKRAAWTFAAAKYLEIQNPFTHYASSEYRNPGNAAPDFLDALKTKFESDTNFHATNNEPRRWKSKLGLQPAVDSVPRSSDENMATLPSHTTSELSGESYIETPSGGVKLVEGLHEMPTVGPRLPIANSNLKPKGWTQELYEIDSDSRQDRLTPAQMVTQHLEKNRIMESVAKSKDTSSYKGLRDTPEARASTSTFTYPYHPPARSQDPDPHNNILSRSGGSVTMSGPISDMSSIYFDHSTTSDSRVSAMSAISPGASYATAPVSAMSSVSSTPYAGHLSAVSPMDVHISPAAPGSSAPTPRFPKFSMPQAQATGPSGLPPRPPKVPTQSESRPAVLGRMPFYPGPESPPPTYSSEAETSVKRGPSKARSHKDVQETDIHKQPKPTATTVSSLLTRKFSWESITSVTAAPATSTPGDLSSSAPSPPISRASSPSSSTVPSGPPGRPISVAISEDIPLTAPMGTPPPIPKKPSQLSAAMQEKPEDGLSVQEMNEEDMDDEKTPRASPRAPLTSKPNAITTSVKVDLVTAQKSSTSLDQDENESSDMYGEGNEAERDDDSQAHTTTTNTATLGRDQETDDDATKAAAAAVADDDNGKENRNESIADSKTDAAAMTTTTMRIKKSLMSLKRNPSWMTRG